MAPFRFTLARRMRALFLLPVIAFAGLLLVVRKLDVTATEARLRQVQSGGAIRQVLLIENRLLEAESSLRGYLQSSDTRLRDAYRHAATAVPGDIDALEAEVADDPQQAVLVRRLRNEAQQKLDALDAGAAGSDDFKTTIGQFLQEEQRLDRTRDATARAARGNVRDVIVIGFALTIAGGLLLGTLLSRILTRRLLAVTETARRLGRGDPAGPTLAGDDEISLVDRSLRDLARDLVEAARRERTIVENTADMISRHTSSGIFLYASPACETLFGYAPEELVGLSLFELFDPEDLTRIRSSAPASFDWSAGAFVTARLRCRDGSMSWVEVNSRPLRDPQSGLVREILAVTRDISKRHRAEESLRQSESRLRSLVENMLGALITIRTDGIIESVNPAAERMFGYPAADLVGRHLEILVPPKAGDDPRRFLSEARKRSLNRITQWEGLRRNGDVFPFEIALFEFQTPEGPRLAGNLIDISGRREVERMKDAFVAAVSHELRTPLTSIRGSLGMLTAGALGTLPPEALEAVSIAERNTLRLIALVNEILDLERLQAGRFEIRPEPISVEALFARAAEAVGGMAGERSVAVHVDPCPLTIEVDADRIVRVLINLLSNAVKFSPAGAIVRLSASGKDDSVEFRVEDHGRGVPDHLREAIFERFRQVEASDARIHGGTGLGLAIAKGIVESHGGSIGVERAPGTGSIFWFRVPVKAASVAWAREAS